VFRFYEDDLTILKQRLRIPDKIHDCVPKSYCS